MQYLKNRKYSILSKVAKYSFIFIIIASLSAPFMFINAEDTTGGVKINTTINNPLGDGLDTIPAFIVKIIEIILTVGVPIVVLAIIYSGFLFVTAQGNEKKLETAKKAFINTMIGAVLLLGAFVIATAIKTTVDDIKAGA